MRLKPLSSRLVVRLKEDEEVTEGGIYLPQTAEKEKSCLVGQVVAETNCDLVSIGEWVLIGAYSGDEFKDENGEYRIVDEDDVLAVVDSF